MDDIINRHFEELLRKANILNVNWANRSKNGQILSVDYTVQIIR